jgi:oligopeptide transport system substrate-binding protein
MKKVLFVLPLAGLLFSCSNTTGGDSSQKEGKGGRIYGGTLRFNETDKLQTLYPSQLTDAISAHVATQIYEGLVKLDSRTLKVVPAIAESYTPDASGTTYTFKLRKNIMFHDDACFPEGKGRELTAQDVVYSFELLCTNDGKNANFSNTFSKRVVGADAFFAAGTSAKAGSLSGVKAIDNYTVQIQLIQPSLSFIEILANPVCGITAKEAVEKYGVKSHVGCGPFMIGNFAPDSSLINLVRNPSYYGKDTLGNQLPFLDTIRISYIDNKSAELTMFEEGKLDFVWGLPGEAVKTFVPAAIEELNAKPPKYILEHSGEMVTQMYEFNTTRAPFNNVKVRQAFNYAINRTRIVESVLSNEAYGPGINGICPPVLPGYKAGEIKGYDYNPELAKKLLAEAGFPDGKDFPTVKLVVNSGGARNTNVASEIQNQLRDVLNVNIDFANVSFQQKLSDARFGRSDIFRSAWVADYPSPETFLSLFYGADVPESLAIPSFPNTSRYKSAKFDSLYDAARTSKTMDEAMTLFREAEQTMMNDAPAMILWYDENYRLTQGRVKNFFSNPMRLLDFSQVYIKDERKKNDKRKDSSADTSHAKEATTEEKKEGH